MAPPPWKHSTHGLRGPGICQGYSSHWSSKCVKKTSCRGMVSGLNFLPGTTSQRSGSCLLSVPHQNFRVPGVIASWVDRVFELVKRVGTRARAQAEF